MSEATVTLTIDGRRTEAVRGETVLQVAERLGIAIPTLCHSETCGPYTSCMVCTVLNRRTGRMIPSCSARAEEGLDLDTCGEAVRDARRTALELLLSDHAGDCVAPCQRGCPGHLNIPFLLRAILDGDLAPALGEARRAVVLPSVLGRICPAPCEKVCRRREIDAPVAICELKRYVGDTELEDDTGASLPPCAPPTGKRVAVIGAGPAGLAAAAQLAQFGHACAVYDTDSRVGGTLKNLPKDRLPHDLVEKDSAWIRRLGVDFHLGRPVDRALFASLRDTHDAVILATGGDFTVALAEFEGLSRGREGIFTEPRVHATGVPGVFAAGSAIAPCRMAVQAVRQGKEAAACADRFMAGQPVESAPARFNSATGKLFAEDLQELLKGASPRMRVAPVAAAHTVDEAHQEAARCLRCDCRRAERCRLRDYAEAYDAKQGRYRGSRRPLQRVMDHPRVAYEPGKCIACGLCVRTTAGAGEPYGLTFLGRGFDLRVGAPFNERLTVALSHSAGACVDACPTGALAWRDDGNEPA